MKHEEFKELYDQLAPRIFFYLHRWLPDRVVCEDLLQEVFVLLYRQDAAPADPRVWLYAAARNVLMNHRRIEAGRRRILQSIIVEQIEDTDLIDAERSAIVAGAVERLPPQTRRIIGLSMQQLTVHEIAERLGISENTVKSTKQAGYRALREALKHLTMIFF